MGRLKYLRFPALKLQSLQYATHNQCVNSLCNYICFNCLIEMTQSASLFYVSLADILSCIKLQSSQYCTHDQCVNSMCSITYVSTARLK